jgi:hypothetical protein
MHKTFLSSWRERQFATVKKTCMTVKTWLMIATTNINQVQEVEYYTFNHVLNHSWWVVFCNVCVAQYWLFCVVFCRVWIKQHKPYKILHRKLKIKQHKPYKILHRKLKIEQHKPYKILHRKLKIEQHKPYKILHRKVNIEQHKHYKILLIKHFWVRDGKDNLLR